MIRQWIVTSMDAELFYGEMPLMDKRRKTQLGPWKRKRSCVMAAFSLLMMAAPLKPQQQGAPKKQTAALPQPGQQVFESMCAGCHGLDAKGGEHAPNIATTPDVQKMSDAELSHIVRGGIPAAGMPGFGSSLKGDQIAAVVSYLRILQGKTKAVAVAGDPAAGRLLFFGKARCSQCHMVAGKGGFIAADLSSYGSSHSGGEIRKAIVEPDANLDPRKQVMTVVAKDGKTYTGVARNEDNFSIQLQTPDGMFHLFEKSEIASFHSEPRSLMPNQYGSTLSKTELDDLVSYLVLAAADQTPAAKEDDDF